MATVRCAYGKCNTNGRLYRKKVRFFRFPDKTVYPVSCLRWVEACGRPGFGVQDVTKNTYLCSRHFYGVDGPTADHPDPIVATSTTNHNLPTCAQVGDTKRRPTLNDTKDPKIVHRSSVQCAADSLDSTSRICKKEDKMEDKISPMFNDSGQFNGTYQDDGATSEFTGFNFPHSDEMKSLFRQIFGLKYFRRNQLQSINACLLDNDCFILMPTGGGKSLCYQLPALMSHGVTFVISPLRSLIQDQVQRLRSLDVPATHLCSNMSGDSEAYVYKELLKDEPGVKLVYITPEKLSCSQVLQEALDNLFQRNLIARFVIDEAHCISQWGHDFRPDYKRLCDLRLIYPGVPIMALTATATPRVRIDILHQLDLLSPKWFLQSFNRPSLKYQVLPKKRKDISSEVITLIFNKFPKASGIIYCLSRRECEEVARSLCAVGLKAAPYHARLDDKRREAVQKSWLNDKVQVICATIAFGMGIDKPNVRYVIHHSLPKSIESYYQESGRAGRDGELAMCILYYSMLDVHRLRFMIQKSSDHASRMMHLENLYKMKCYCENKTDCRRAQQLGYFGEVFDSNLCRVNSATACDNCSTSVAVNTLNLTADAKAIVSSIVELVGTMPERKKDIPMSALVDLFRGIKNEHTAKLGLDEHPLQGKGAAFLRIDVERFMSKLIIENYLLEDITVGSEQHVVSYIRPGENASQLLKDGIEVQLAFVDNQVASHSENNAFKMLEAKCLEALVAECKALGEEHQISYTNVMNSQALQQMSQELPTTESEMFKIPHVTAANFKKYGCRLLDITQRFAAEKIVLLSEVKHAPNLRTGVEKDWEPNLSSCASSSSASSRKRKGSGGSKRRYKRRRKSTKKTKSKPKSSSCATKKATKSKRKVKLPKNIPANRKSLARKLANLV